MAETKIMVHMRTLILYQEAAKAAMAQGKTEAAEGLQKQVEEKIKRIKETVGDIFL